MKTLTEIQQVLKKEKPVLVQRYGVRELGLFGSYVRGEEMEGSDLDILVELEDPPRIGLIGFIELEHYLSDLLGIKADLVIREDLKPHIGERILREVLPV